MKEHCPQLTSLTVDWSKIPKNAPQFFWSTVSGIETLVLRHYEFCPNRDLAEHRRNPKDFPRMKNLTWCNVNGDGADLLFVELLKCMSVLESLHWSRSEQGEYDLHFNEIAKFAAMGQIWTSLHSLALEELPDTLTDADLALILSSVAPSTLRKLSVVDSHAGPAFFACLKERGQLNSLEELGWRNCKDIDAAMGQEALESCP